MPSRQHYLQQAKAFRDLAATVADKASAAWLLERANEYTMLAQELPDAGALPSSPPPEQPQAQQQPQGKLTDDDK